MAEGLLLTCLPESLKPFVTVLSAGTMGLHGNRAEPFAVRAAAIHGADISGHRAKRLDAPMIRASDLVLVMENHHLHSVNQLLFFRCKYSYLLGNYSEERECPEIEDPYGLALDAYKTCADEIVDCMPGVIDHIKSAVNGER